MSTFDSCTSAELAERAGLNERYVREWLGAMVTGAIVEYDTARKRYYLPGEHAAWLTRSAAPNNLASATQWVAVLGGVEDEVLAAFSHGRGVPYASYHRFHEVMAEESSQTVIGGLLDHILPLIPGLIADLERGIDVLDVGCGSGWAMTYLASKFPQSRFHGYDFSAEGIQAAHAHAKQQGVHNVQFKAIDAAAMDDTEQFDLITAFDAIHDQSQPGKVLANIARALRPAGTFLMQDIMGTGNLDDDRQLPMATFCYAISCMHCMSVSLANGGPGLGAMWGKPLALQMLFEASFNQVRVETLPHDLLNYYYLAKR